MSYPIRTNRHAQVEITVSRDDEMTSSTVTGPPAQALRACILRIADRFATDPDMVRLADAVAAVEIKP